MRYYEEIVLLGRKLAGIFALALDLEETYFDKYIKLPAAIARVLYYPSQTGEVDMKELGIGAHRYKPTERVDVVITSCLRFCCRMTISLPCKSKTATENGSTQTQSRFSLPLR
jgi:hypothetical protein